MDRLAWLKEVGQRYINRIKAEQPVVFIELEIAEDEYAAVLELLSHCRMLPWESWAHSSVTMAAVQVAANATEDETSFVHTFLKKLNTRYSQEVWEQEYGKRIELFLAKYFPDELPRSGAFRYVAPIYRHAGIPRIAVPRFAKFLRRLLREYGPSFTRGEYQKMHMHLSGVASQFLSGEYGFQYARDAARVLNRIDTGLIDRADLALIPGYRRNFWTDVIDAAGPTHGATRPSSGAAGYADPFLALSDEGARLVLRFDERAVAAGVVTMNGSSVLYAETPIRSSEVPLILMSGQRTRIRWWIAGNSDAALFRVSDGRFVAAEGGVPPGNYYLAAHESITPAADLHADEVNYLDGSDYRVWRICAISGARISEDLCATETTPIPQIEFAVARRHPLGVNSFADQLPDLIVRNWDGENASRFLLLIDDGRGPQSLKLPPGCDGLQVSACCPSTGAIWLEPKGVHRQACTLPRLPFCVLPAEIALQFTEQYFWADEPAFARISVPRGWRVSPSPAEGGLLKIAKGDRLLEGTLQNGNLRVPFSVRVPRVDLQIHPRERIWWQGDGVENRTLYVEGVSGLDCGVSLLDERGEVRLIEPSRIGASGILRLRAAAFRDALELAASVAGEFAVCVSGKQPLPAGWYFASSARITERIWCLPPSSPVFRLPTLGDTLRLVRDLQTRELPAFDCAFSRQAFPVRCWLSGIALCAQTFDNTQLNTDVSEYADGVIRALCDWYKQAASCMIPGEPSAAILRGRPVDLRAVPLSRWQDKVKEQIRRLELQSDLARLIAEWRDAVIRLDGTAIETVLAKRPGGDFLTSGAEWYLRAMRHQGTTRAKALNHAIGDLQRSRETTDCSFVRAAAAMLLYLSYERSDRTEYMTYSLRDECRGIRFSAADISPWDGDNGANRNCTGAMATDSPTA